MSDVIIKVENLTKTFKLYNHPKDRLKEALSPFRKKYHHEYHALKDISFEIKKGESVGILGKNGAGKSTLLKILTGVLTPTSGKVAVNGRIAALLELGSGFNPDLSGMENVYFQGAIMGFSREEMEKKVSEIIEFADIGEFKDQPVRTYSSGMFARLAFAISINVEPDILIVDEALSVGDTRFQLKCFRKLESLKSDGVTIIFVTHSILDVVRICNKAIWIDEGLLRKQGESKRITEEYYSWMAYGATTQKPLVEIELNQSFKHGFQLSPIPKDAHVTGDVGAFVLGVGFFLEDGKPIKIFEGNKKVRIVYDVISDVVLENPYFGFQIINSKGLKILGSNNHVAGYALDPIYPGNKYRITFSFYFPELENGNYVIALGVNDGSLDTHVRYQNVWEAYEFTFQSKSLFQRQSVILKLNDCKIDYQKVE